MTQLVDSSAECLSNAMITQHPKTHVKAILGPHVFQMQSLKG